VRKAPVEMACYEKPSPLGIVVGETSAKLYHTRQVGSGLRNSHVETSLDARTRVSAPRLLVLQLQHLALDSTLVTVQTSEQLLQRAGDGGRADAAVRGIAERVFNRTQRLPGPQQPQALRAGVLVEVIPASQHWSVRSHMIQDPKSLSPFFIQSLIHHIDEARLGRHDVQAETPSALERLSGRCNIGRAGGFAGSHLLSLD